MASTPPKHIEKQTLRLPRPRPTVRPLRPLEVLVLRRLHHHLHFPTSTTFLPLHHPHQLLPNLQEAIWVLYSTS